MRRLDARGTSIEHLTRVWKALPAVRPPEMLGFWRGTGVTSGSVFSTLLRETNWYGKVFPNVDALVFSSPHSLLALVNYATIVPWRLPERRAFRRHPLGAARLVESNRFGSTTAAMAYRYLPVIDHFRRLNDTSVMGLMQIDRRDIPELFFVLELVGGSCQTGGLGRFELPTSRSRTERASPCATARTKQKRPLSRGPNCGSDGD